MKYIEVGFGLQRDCSQREPSDELDSHGGRVFLQIVEGDDDDEVGNVDGWCTMTMM